MSNTPQPPNPRSAAYRYIAPETNERVRSLVSAPYSAWLLIADAPNSLTQILITDGSSAWVDQKLGVKSDEEAGDYYFNGHENWEEVTHWMPLPPLPNSMTDVLAAQGDTIKVLHTLTPVGVAMAGADVFDPYRD